MTGGQLDSAGRNVDALISAVIWILGPTAREVQALSSIPSARPPLRPVDFDEAILAGSDVALRGSSNRDDDLRLARAAAAGDQDAWRQIVSRYSSSVRALTFKRLPVKLMNDRDDVLQEVFVKVYAGLASYMGLASLKTWILRIAYHHIFNRARDTRRRLAHEVLESEVATEEPISLDDMGVSREPSPADGYGGRERRTVALRIFREVDEPYRLAIVLTAYWGCSYEETARLLGVKPGTVKSRVSRGRAIISAKMKAAGLD